MTAKIQYPHEAPAERPVRCGKCRARGIRWPDGAVDIEHATTCERYVAKKGKRAQPAQKPAKKIDSLLAGARTRKAPASPSVGSEAAKAAEVVRLRDEDGLSWVAIGAKLGLPGAKSGAATARKLYASTGASYRGTTARQPVRQPRERKAPKPKPEGKKATKARVRSGDHLIPLDTPDLELYHMLRGRKIRWSIDVSKLPGAEGEPVFMEEEAVVHPEHLEIDRGEDGTEEPYLNFREMEGTRDGIFATRFRCIRLSQVHEVL